MAFQGWNTSLDPQAVYKEILGIGSREPASQRIYTTAFDYFNRGLSGLPELDFQIFEVGALWLGYNPEFRNSRENELFKIRLKNVLQGFSGLNGAFEKYIEHNQWELTHGFYTHSHLLWSFNVDKFLENFRNTFTSENPIKNNPGY